MYSTGMKAYDQYRELAVQTANPGKLLLMLYDGLVLFLKQAGNAIESGSSQDAHNFLLKAQDIISELICTLNMDYEVSKNLFQLYDYLKRRLVEANLKKDKQIVEEVLSLATELRDTWAQVVEPTRAEVSSR
jgi:flagellar protein FliS